MYEYRVLRVYDVPKHVYEHPASDLILAFKQGYEYVHSSEYIRPELPFDSTEDRMGYIEYIVRKEVK